MYSLPSGALAEILGRFRLSCMMAGLWLVSYLVVPSASGGQVVISEIMYSAPGQLPEWVEVQNLTATPLDMAEWSLSGSAMEYRFPSFSAGNPGNTLLKPFECLLIRGKGSQDFLEAYPTVGQARVYGPWSGKLKRGDHVALRDKNGVVLSQVDYKSRGDWPIAADGAGHSLELIDPDGEVNAAGNWRASPQRLGTPGTRQATDPSDVRRVPGVRLNEVHFAANGAVDWVEVYNDGDRIVPASDSLFLASRRDFSDRRPLGRDLPPHTIASIEVGFSATDEAHGTPVFLVDASLTVVDARAFPSLPPETSWQVFPQSGREWYNGSSPSRDRANTPHRHTEVVINEIMYDPPSGHEDGEFIELYHRGPDSTDLSGWRLTVGVDFTFPEGTKLGPGAYLVIARNTEYLRRVYGDIPVVGNLRKKLGNRGDRVRLEDGHGNLVWEVEYRAGGSWPALARGGGSSLELINPDLDGRHASAWADSDESGKSSFQTFRHRGQYEEWSPQGCESDYRELHLHAVGTGHLLLRNIELRDTRSGTNYLEKSGLQSQNGSSAAGWLIQGNHAESFMEDGVLHLISGGHGDNRANRAEIDIPAITRGSPCELGFEARWVSGSSRLIAQTWDHSIASSFLIPIPADLGTPGRRNSRFVAEPPPVVDGLRHWPAVPRGDKPVRVSATVTSLTPPAKVVVLHRSDSALNDQPWISTPMFRSPAETNRSPSDSVSYEAELDYRGDGQIVQFYVRAESDAGTFTEQPRQGEKHPAMLVIDSRTVPADLRTSRFIVSAYDEATIAAGETSRYGFRFPKSSNHYLNTTFISNEREVYYGAQIRRSGSAWNRSDTLSRGKWKPPADRPFRGLHKLVFDDDAEGQRRYSDRFVNYLLYLLGHPSSEVEFIRVIVNRGPPMLREEVEPVDSDLLRRNFQDGNTGNLYRIDDEWWFDDDWTPHSRDADWSFKGSRDPGRYRTEWMKRSNEEADEFSDLIHFFEVVSSRDYTQEQIEELIDPHALMKIAAVSGYVANWDTFTQSRGKNGYFYRRPGDGRFQMLHWDSDAAFDSGAELPFYGRHEPFRGWVEKPYNLRLFCGYLKEILDQWTEHSPRMLAWLQVQHAANPATGCDIARFESWFQQRGAVARRFFGDGFAKPFTISPPVTATAGVTSATIRLGGGAPYGVIHVRVDGRPALKCRWISSLEWVFDAVPLAPGPNRIGVVGTDQWGRLLHSAEVTVDRK